MNKNFKKGLTAFRQGFTLIELLIVIAILGVLAVVILVAINPQEQLARTRDAGRTSTVTQLGHALQAYGTSHEGDYVTEGNTWVQALVTAGEIATVPDALNYSITGTGPCSTGGVQNGLCYDTDGNTPPNAAIVFARLESGSNDARCTSTQNAFVVFDTVKGRGGIVCSATAPSFNAAGQTFIN
jgi:prepilin-type N-terminal cleavage/methylation domain